MFYPIIFVFCLLISKCHTAFVLHEKRDNLPAHWTRSSAISRRSDTKLHMGIALVQNNLDQAYHFLMNVSDPSSPNFGQHWTARQVAETFAPSKDTVDAAKAWLTSSGISESHIRLSSSTNWLYFNASVAEAEQLLQTQYTHYVHDSGKTIIACEAYSIPENLTNHIDFITPTLHFDLKVTQPNGTSRWETPRLNNQTQLENCSSAITPDCLRALYNIPLNKKLLVNDKNSYGVVALTPNAYLQNDLDIFFANYSPAQIGQSPILQSIDGGFEQTYNQSFSYNAEPDLDLEYAMSLVYPQPVTLLQTGDYVEGGSFNNFLDALDATYCTYDGGDTFPIDPVFPDPYTNYSYPYEGPQNCGGFAASKVISTSYSYNEHDLTPAYEMRQCHEYMKLALQGTTFLFSSGDYGVASHENLCVDAETGAYTNGSYGLFTPTFPAGCPYIVSVGATQIRASYTLKAGIDNSRAEVAASTKIHSGGGFSNVFAVPDYQKPALESYFAAHNPPYGADRYNTSQSSRGHPDVSANGVNFVSVVNGQTKLLYGTSAATPTFAALLTLINQARMNVGKSSVGFVNPVFYQYPELFHDITEGTNPGCGTDGFEATEGWDPVTGLGTPDYEKLKQKYLELP